MATPSDSPSKLALLAVMKEQKDILLGAFCDNLTKVDKAKSWKEVYDNATASGMIPPAKDWTYIRDAMWPNMRKNHHGE